MRSPVLIIITDGCAFLIKQYFNDTANVSIDVFDSVSLNRVYQDVINVLTAHLDIEVSVLQALSYCFYEILDNVHTRAMTPAQREDLQNSTAHYLEGALAPYHIPYTSIY